jgi:CPA1 family monovalent cation:H+ antiporter
MLLAAAGLSTQEELIIVGLLAAVTALLVLAPLVGVPYPILLVMGGLVLGLLPGVPALELPPELVLVAFLPPLLYSAALFSSPHELRRNIRPITLLALGLVLATVLTVAAVAHSVAGLSWPAAFVLGAIVSPTDPLAATSIARRLGVPARVVTIVEGESLVNDAAALVAFRFAVAAVLTGTFSLSDAVVEFLVGAVVGIVIGLAVGWVVTWVLRRIDDPITEITILLVSSYFAFLPAEALDASAVLAAVSAGLYVGWHAPRLLTVETRLPSLAVWEIFIFGANSLLFVLVGLQLPVVVEGLEDESWPTLLGYGAVVSATVILTRLAWVFPFTYLPRMLFRRIRERDPAPPWQAVTLVGWMGLRGAVSMAAALAVPHELDSGAPFDERDLIVFLAFAVILVTLVLQGLSMPPLIRALGVRVDRSAEEREEARARVRAAEAAIARIDELMGEDWVSEAEARNLWGMYDHRRRRYAARGAGGRGDPELERRSEAVERLTRELIEAEREAIVSMRNAGEINDEVMRRIERDLDLEHARLIEPRRD